MFSPKSHYGLSFTTGQVSIDVNWATIKIYCVRVISLFLNLAFSDTNFITSILIDSSICSWIDANITNFYLIFPESSWKWIIWFLKKQFPCSNYPMIQICVWKCCSLRWTQIKSVQYNYKTISIASFASRISVFLPNFIQVNFWIFNTFVGIITAYHWTLFSCSLLVFILLYFLGFGHLK